MRAQLTKRLVATAQPKDRPYELRDTLVRGLLLRVQPSGHKAWIVTWAPLEPTHNARFQLLMDVYLPHWRQMKSELNSLPVRHEDWGY